MNDKARIRIEDQVVFYDGQPVVLVKPWRFWHPQMKMRVCWYGHVYVAAGLGFLLGLMVGALVIGVLAVAGVVSS